MQNLKKKPLVSVIVPIYKVEKSLNRCVRSITSQTYQDLQIILVDDGSPDRSPALCDEWAQKDNRIRVIHKENGGLSDARNAGLAIAAGEYVAFVDSDDYIESNYVERMVTAALEQKASLVICSFYSEDAHGQCVGNQGEIVSQQTTVDPHECFRRGVSDWRYVVAWNKLYDRHLWDGVHYPVGCIHEDEFVFHQFVPQCFKVVLLPDCLYHYVENQSSITHSEFSVKNLVRIDAMVDRIAYFYRSGQYDLIAPSFGRMLVDVGRAGVLLQADSTQKISIMKHVAKICSLPLGIVRYLSITQKIRFVQMIIMPMFVLRILGKKTHE